MARRWVALVAFAASAQGWLWSSFGATEEAAPAGAYGEGTVARLSEVRAGEALAGVLASSGALVVGVDDPEDAVGAVAEAAFGAFSAGAGLGAWRAYAARTESEPEAFVFRGAPARWRGSAPDDVVAGAEAALVALRRAYDVVVEGVGASGVGAGYRAIRASPDLEVHVAFHPAAMESMACAAHGESDRDVDGMGLTIVSARSVGGADDGHVRLHAQKLSTDAWVGACVDSKASTRLQCSCIRTI